MSVLNGNSYSRFFIAGSGDAPGVTIDLPLANSMIENYDIRTIEHELIGLDISNPELEIAQEILGAFITFTFDFSEWITAETLKNKIETIYQSAKSGRLITLYPRIDVPTRFFEVKWTTTNFDLGIGASGNINHLPVFTFKTRRLEPEWKWEIKETASPVIGGSYNVPFEGYKQT